jgi:hypothetical protein
VKITLSFLRAVKLVLTYLFTHPTALVIGGVVGCYCGLSVLFTGDDPQHPQGGVLAKLEIPLFALVWVLTKLFGVSIERAMGIMLCIHFPYWILLGSLMFVGIAAAWQKLIGDE